MRGLVRHHPVIRALPKTAGAAMATATIGLNVLVFESLRRGSFLGVDRYGLFELLILLGGLYLLVMNETGHRATRWAEALPIGSRTLWSGHARALVLAASLVILAMAGVVAGFALLLSRLDPLELHSPARVLIHFARPWLVLLAAVLCLAAWRPGLADPHRAPGWKRTRMILAAGAVLTLVLLQSLPLVIGLFPVVAAALWAARSGSGIPAVLTRAVAPAGARVPAFAEAAPASPAGVRAGVLHWVILRQLFKWPLTWILGVPMTFLLGMVQGGAFSYSLDADFARYFNLWITAYMLIAFVGHFIENLHRVDHLPVSRSLLLRWLVLPNLAALMLGGLTGFLMDAARTPGEAIGFENDRSRDHHGLLVPVDLWRPAWGEGIETVTAPWGESHPAASVPVVRWLPLRLWKPYTTVPEASPDFVAWQISRAVEAAYGVAVDPDEIRNRYLVAGPDGVVAVREGGLNPVADGLVEARRTKGPIQGLLVPFIVCLALGVFVVIFALCGPGNSVRRTKTVFWSAMGFLMVFHLGGYGLLMSRQVQEWTVTSLMEGAAGRLAALGIVGWALPWVVGAGLAVLLWVLCERAFARVEAARGRSSCTL